MSSRSEWAQGCIFLSHYGFAAAERDEDGKSNGVDGGGDVEDGDPAAAGHLQDVPGEVHPQEPFQHGVNNQRVDCTIRMLLFCALLVSSMTTNHAKSCSLTAAGSRVRVDQF